MLKKSKNLSLQHNSCLTNSDKNNTNNTENIYEENENCLFNYSKKFNNLTNNNEDIDSYVFNYKKKENLNYAKNERENIFYDKYINCFSIFPFYKENNFDNFEKKEKSELNDF